jgi:GT2 family glycosyltransferase
VPYLPLACVLLRLSAYHAVGGLDPRFTFYFEDQDYARRCREAGWALGIYWDAEALHVGGGSSAAQRPAAWFEVYHRGLTIFLRKHYPFAWLLHAAAWAPRALAHAVIWRSRALARRVKGDAAGAQQARAWAATFWRSVW